MGCCGEVKLTIDDRNQDAVNLVVEELALSTPLVTFDVTPTEETQPVVPPEGYGFSGGVVQAIPEQYRDTSDADIKPSDVLDGKVAYGADGKVVGKIKTLTARTIVPTTADQVIESGEYLAGDQIIKGSSNLVASNIREGVEIFGVAGSIPTTKVDDGVIFYDFDGTIVAQYSFAELPISELPTPPNHDDIGAIFDGWTLTSEQINEYAKEHYLLTATPYYHSADSATHFFVDIPQESWEIQIEIQTPRRPAPVYSHATIVIDWGDGLNEEVQFSTNSKVVTHIFSAAGLKNIAINIKEPLDTDYYSARLDYDIRTETNQSISDGSLLKYFIGGTLWRYVTQQFTGEMGNQQTQYANNLEWALIPKAADAYAPNSLTGSIYAMNNCKVLTYPHPSPIYPDKSPSLMSYDGYSCVDLIAVGGTEPLQSSSPSYLFSNCVKLERINILSATILATNALSGLLSLISANLPAITVAPYSLADTPSLKYLNMPQLASGSDIGSMSQLQTIELPQLTKMGSGFLDGVNSLRTLVLPALSSISGGALQKCTSLRELDAPELESITGSNAGSSLVRLERLHLPKLATCKSSSAFRSCSRLQEVSLPSLTGSIGSSFLYGCSIKHFVVPAGVTSIGSSFLGCNPYHYNTLKTVTFLSPTPPTFSGVPFRNGSTNANLEAIYVPVGSLEAYQTATNLTPYADVMVEGSSNNA